MTLPVGRSEEGSCVPLMIWRRTGTVGGMKGAPLTEKKVPFYATRQHPQHTNNCKETHEAEVQVDGEDTAARTGTAGGGDVRQRHEVLVVERVLAEGGGRLGFNRCPAFVAQDGGVHTTVRGDRAEVRNSPDPVVVDVLVRLVGIELRI